jgi:hypothetical protein
VRACADPKLLEKHRAFSADNPHTDLLRCGSFEGTFTTVDFFAVSESQINSSFRLQQNYSKGGLGFFFILLES